MILYTACRSKISLKKMPDWVAQSRPKNEYEMG